MCSRSILPQNLYDYPRQPVRRRLHRQPADELLHRQAGQGRQTTWPAVFGDNKIIIPPSKLAKFADEDYIGKEVYMGIRPENIHDEDVFIQAAPNAVVDCNVEVTELMGSETYLYLSHQRQGREHHRPRQSPHHQPCRPEGADCVRRQPPALLRQGDRDHAAYPADFSTIKALPVWEAPFFSEICEPNSLRARYQGVRHVATARKKKV